MKSFSQTSTPFPLAQLFIWNFTAAVLDLPTRWQPIHSHKCSFFNEKEYVWQSKKYHETDYVLYETNSVWKIHKYIKEVPSTVDSKSISRSLIYLFPHHCQMMCPVGCT